jgi:tetratricopeptide (TPR) repeat protein
MAPTTQPRPYLKPSPESARALLRRGIAGEVVMLNLLRFRAIADYSAHPELAPDTPISGAEAFARYVAHTLPLLRDSGGQWTARGEKALLHVEQAGDRAMAQYANVTAVGYYHELVDRLDGMGRARDAAAAREKLGTVLRTSGHYDRALDVLDQAAEGYRVAGDWGSVGRVVAQIGHVHGERGTPDEGLGYIRPLVDMLEESGPAYALAPLYHALAHLFFVGSRYTEQLAVAERAAEFARAAGDDRVLAGIEEFRSLALIMLGRAEEALPVLEEAVELAHAVGDLHSLCWDLSNTAGVYYRRGEFHRAKHYGRRRHRAVHLGGRCPARPPRARGDTAAVLRGAPALLHQREVHAPRRAAARAVPRQQAALLLRLHSLGEQGQGPLHPEHTHTRPRAQARGARGQDRALALPSS